MEPLDPTRQEILLKAFDHSQTQLRHLQNRAQTLMSWIASLLLAIIGIVGTLAGGKISSADPIVRPGLIVTVLALFLFAWISEWLTFRARVAEHHAVVRIAKLLHLFEAGYFDDKTAVYD